MNSQCHDTIKSSLPHFLERHLNDFSPYAKISPWLKIRLSISFNGEVLPSAKIIYVNNEKESCCNLSMIKKNQSRMDGRQIRTLLFLHRETTMKKVALKSCLAAYIQNQINRCV